ncbi:MAG: hypothetical protein MJ051_04640 [Akkermansia sp.]|nr:hypothetical protein [Akkermansia sp.]
MNERLLHAIEQELRLSETELTETERYLRRFRVAPLPAETQQRVLHAVSAAPARPYRRATRIALAASVAALLLAGALLFLPTDERTAPIAKQLPAAPASGAAEVTVQPVYTVRLADGSTEYSLRTPVVFVADDVL